MHVIEDFFVELDRLWLGEARGRKVRLSIIGCGALMPQASYERGTKDSDVFETTELTHEIKQWRTWRPPTTTPRASTSRRGSDLVQPQPWRAD